MSVANDKVHFHVSGLPNSTSLQLLATDEEAGSEAGVITLYGLYPFLSFELKNSGGAQNTTLFEVEMQMYAGGAWHVFDNWNPDPPAVATTANGASNAAGIRLGPVHAIRFKAAIAVADAAVKIDIEGVAAEMG